MIDSQRTDRWCIAFTLLAVLICVVLLIFGSLWPQQAPQPLQQLGISQQYADTLFDQGYVHTINILVPEVNWHYMADHAMDEQYVVCDAEIDGELISGIAIRPKGNSSLASIAGQGSDHFSFKIEFDHYTAGKTFRGLDKLALNNLGQDISCMKDFLSYTMMADMQVPGPLCAYTLVQLNGEDFGLYLMVEGIEDSFAARSYGDWQGNFYRPDVYAIESITPAAFMHADEAEVFQVDVNELTPGDRMDALGPIINIAFASMAEQARISAGGYAGDDPSAYSVVFDTAVFDMQTGDAARYVAAVRTLCTSADPLDALDKEAVCRYFAVHNFINNYDSYTGIFAHNYYLCESNGKLSLIPWDYNLGFGAFSAESAYKCFARASQWYQPMALGASMTTEKSFVNYPIDTPLISAELEDRPILRYLLEDETGLALYHEACQTLIDQWFTSGRYIQLMEQTAQLIRPYVQQGLTFYAADDFDTAVGEVEQYGVLRAQSMQGQLKGEIPATMEGQQQEYANLIDVGDLDMSLTIDFGGLAFGITSEEVCAILDAVFDGYEVADLEALVADMTADPSKIVAMVGRVISSSKLISGALINAVVPPVLLVISILAAWIAVKRIKRRKGEDACS